MGNFEAYIFSTIIVITNSHIVWFLFMNLSFADFVPNFIVHGGLLIRKKFITKDDS